MKIIKVNNKSDLKHKTHTTVLFKTTKYIIHANKAWDVKKYLYNKLKIGVSKQQLCYKNKILNNKTNTTIYDFIILRKK